MIKKFLKFNENQNGAVAIIVAVFMTTFLGLSALAIDVGVTAYSKNELQNAADAAALAGARQLAEQDYENAVDQGPIKQAAIRAAGLNYTSTNDSSIVIKSANVVLRNWDWDTSDFSNDVPPPYNSVEVTISNHAVNLFFASNRNMGARAVAILGPIDGTNGLLPFALDKDEAEEFKKEGVGTPYIFGKGPGNWGTVDFSDTAEEGAQGGGASEIGDWLPNGSEGDISKGDTIYTKTGVGAIQKNRNAVLGLVDKIRVIPIIDGGFPNGKSQASEVIDFVAIRITGLDGNGSNTTIVAEYIEQWVVGGGIDFGDQNSGVLAVKLVQ